MAYQGRGKHGLCIGCAYFEDVWGWKAGVHFVFLAPFNTMAARLNGDTIHSWGEVEWEADGPGGGNVRGGGKSGKGCMSSMAAKMELLRFVLIDEIEAAGASLLGKLQQHMAEAAREALFKYRPGCRNDRPRPFGGINLLGFGDLLATSSAATNQHMLESE